MEKSTTETLILNKYPLATCALSDWSRAVHRSRLKLATVIDNYSTDGWQKWWKTSLPLLSTLYFHRVTDRREQKAASSINQKPHTPQAGLQHVQKNPFNMQVVFYNCIDTRHTHLKNTQTPEHYIWTKTTLTHSIANCHNLLCKTWSELSQVILYQIWQDLSYSGTHQHFYYCGTFVFFQLRVTKP